MGRQPVKFNTYLCVFYMFFVMFAASPAPMKDSTKGFGQPKAASFMGAGEAANIAKNIWNTHRYALNLHIYAYLCIYFAYSLIFSLRGGPWSYLTLAYPVVEVAQGRLHCGA